MNYVEEIYQYIQDYYKTNHINELKQHTEGEFLVGRTGLNKYLKDIIAKLDQKEWEIVTQKEKWFKDNKQQRESVLSTVLGKLEEEQINYCILKGIALSEFFEAENIERIYADVDMLVQKEQVLKVIEILGGLGFKYNYRVDDLEIKDNLLPPYKVDKKGIYNDLFIAHQTPTLCLFDDEERLIIKFDLHIFPHSIMDVTGREDLGDAFLKSKIRKEINGLSFYALNDLDSYIYMF